MKGDVICWQLASRRGREREKEGRRAKQGENKGERRHSQRKEGRGKREE